VRQAIPKTPERRVCRVLDVSRSSLLSVPAERRQRRPLDRVLVERIRKLIRRHPTFGDRRLWALLRFADGLIVNLKALYRILKAKRWFLHQRSVTPRLRVQGRRSIAPASDERWAMDLTHIYCGEDGWGHLAAIIDCCRREIVGYEFALRGRAREAERALEGACLRCFGTLRPEGPTPVVRSDNGLIFTARRFRAACRDYRLQQEWLMCLFGDSNAHSPDCLGARDAVEAGQDGDSEYAACHHPEVGRPEAGFAAVDRW
jgi:putative transposase